MSENCSGPPCIYQKERVCNSTGMHTQMEQTNSRNCCIKAQRQVHRLGNLDLARNLAICEGVNKVCYTQAVFDLPNLFSGWIQRNCPFSARIRICESSFGADSPAKPEVLSGRMTSHQHRQRKQTIVTSHSTTPTNPDCSICQWIRIWIRYETESRFGRIEYGLRHRDYSPVLRTAGFEDNAPRETDYQSEQKK